MFLKAALLILCCLSTADAEPFAPIFDNTDNVISKVTVVSGHWVAKSTKHPLSHYKKW